jgi:hypothetical protein
MKSTDEKSTQNTPVMPAPDVALREDGRDEEEGSYEAVTPKDGSVDERKDEEASDRKMKANKKAKAPKKAKATKAAKVPKAPRPIERYTLGNTDSVKRGFVLAFVEFVKAKGTVDIPTLIAKFSGRQFDGRKVTPDRVRRYVAYCRAHGIFKVVKAAKAKAAKGGTQ